jgi:two-component system sensor histidine kinase HydH
MNKKKIHTLWIATPPWIIIGAVIILVPIFLFWTFDTIKRQKEGTRRLLLEKGAALIRSFEAGTRTGMMGGMGMNRSRFQLQRLLMETAQQPDIVYIIVTDINGVIKAHSDPDRLGRTYGETLDITDIIQSKRLRWRLVSYKDNASIFEVFRQFSPIKIDPRARHRGMMSTPPPEDTGEKAQIIYIGLDMTPFEAARKEDTRHILIMASILLLIGFAGIFSLFLVQAYRSTRSSLNRIKAFSDNVVENMPVGLIALDADRRIASVNQAAESLLQVPLMQIIGKSTVDILPGQVSRILDDVESSGKTIEREMDCRFPDERTVPLDVSVSPLQSDDAFLGYIILCRDLTEVQTLKREIERSRRLASIGRLAAGVAHEIRNPLSSIKGFATYFKERYEDIPEDKKTAEIMVQEVERLNRVISQLLEFARPVTIQKKPVAIQTLTRHSLKMIEADARAKNIKISSNIPSDLRDIAIDADRINQALLNLYLNAIEAMNDSQRLAISVSDTGHGIDKEDLVHIFDPYFTTKQSGTGLGLAIVHKIVESHQGEIRVESEPNKGTTVRIFLPYDR